MKKCIICGALLEEDAVFCSYCGKKIELHTCPNCGAEIEDDSVFCSKCGMRLQAIPEETLPHETEIQEVEITPKKSNSIWYVTCCIGVVLLVLGGLYAYKYFKRIPEKEISTPVTDVNSKEKLSLVGDADGFPLTLDLIIDNGNVTGSYKNVKYGTTMTVTGTLVDNVFNLNGEADNTTYTFRIVAEGEKYTGTFGRVSGKKMKLHLRNSLSKRSVLIDGETDSETMTKKRKESICLAYKNACDDIINRIDSADYYDLDVGYFLYDITGDGVPELWIKYGICEADYEMIVCTYDQGCNYETIRESNAVHCCFYEGNGYILQLYAHMGEAYWTKLTYNGKKIVETTIYEENVTEVDDEGHYFYRDYKTPTERYIELYSLHNLEPIKRALGLE